MISEKTNKRLRGVCLLAIIILALILPNTCAFAQDCKCCEHEAQCGLDLPCLQK